MIKDISFESIDSPLEEVRKGRKIKLLILFQFG